LLKFTIRLNFALPYSKPLVLTFLHIMFKIVLCLLLVLLANDFPRLHVHHPSIPFTKMLTFNIHVVILKPTYILNHLCMCMCVCISSFLLLVILFVA
jgi:uncharacterized membrane protein YagU involved in acid resistance